MRSDALTVEEYLDELTPVTREAISAVRNVVLENLPEGYEEVMDFGMISYVVPLSTFPRTYNGHPLMYVALGAQKHHMAIYVMSLYNEGQDLGWFAEEYRAAGKKLDMGKCCVRFKRLDDLPLDLVGRVIARTPMKSYIAYYQEARGDVRPRKR